MTTVVTHALAVLGRRRISINAEEISLSESKAEVADDDYESKVNKVAKGPVQVEPIPVKGRAAAQEMDHWRQLHAERDPATATVPLGFAYGFQVGVTGYFVPVKVTKLTEMAKRAERYSYEATLRADDAPVYGRLLRSDIGTAGTADPTPATRPSDAIEAASWQGLDLGPLTAGRELVVLVATLDPPGVEGADPSFELVVESDVSDAWSAPAPRLTVPTITGPGAHWLTLDGDANPVTDTQWRLAVTTVGGTAPRAWFAAWARIRNKE